MSNRVHIVNLRKLTGVTASNCLSNPSGNWRRPTSLLKGGLLLLMGTVMLGGMAFAQGNFQSNATGNWNVAGTWTLVSGADADGIPDANDNATILSPHTVSLVGASAATAVTIDLGGTLNTNGNTLTASGNFTLNGTWSGTGTVTLTGAATTISGAGSSTGASSLSITTGAKSIVAGSNLSFAGNVAITGAITATNNGDVSIAGNLTGSVAGSTWLNAASSNLSIGGALLATGTLTATANPNTVNYNGTAALNQTVKGTTYHHLSVTRGASNAALITAATTLNGDLLVASGTLDARGVNVTVNGTTTLGGTLTFTTSAAGAKIFVGAVIIDPTGSWTNPINEGFTLRGGITNNGSFSSGTGTYAFNTNSQTLGGANGLSFGGVVSITGAITITNGTTVTITGNLTGSVAGSTWLNSTNSTLIVAAAVLVTGTLDATANPNTVNYNGAAAVNQTVKGTTYHHLTVTRGASNVALINAATSVNGNLSVASGTLDLRGANVTVNGTTDVTGTLTFTTSVVGIKTFVGAVTINAGGSWTAVVNEGATLQGGLTHNGITFTSGTGVYLFDTNNQNIGGASAIAITNMTVSGVTLTNSGSLTVSTSLIGTGGFTNASGATLTIGATAANFGITTLTASATGNIVDYSSAGAQTVRAADYYDLTVSGARGANSVTFENGGTIGVAGALTLSATFSTGGYIVTNNTVDFNGSSPQTIPAFVFNNLTSSNSGTKTAAAAVTVNGNFNNSTITSMVTFTLTIAGTRTNSGTMQFAGETNGLVFIDGTVEYNGTAVQAPAGQTVAVGTYANLLFSNDATKRVFGGTVHTQSSLTVGSSGPLSVESDGILQVDGDMDNQGSITNAGAIRVGI